MFHFNHIELTMHFKLMVDYVNLNSSLEMIFALKKDPNFIISYLLAAFFLLFSYITWHEYEYECSYTTCEREHEHGTEAQGCECNATVVGSIPIIY